MASRSFVGEPPSIRAARQFVRDLLDESGVDPLTAELLTSELATNVVQHARTDFDVVVTVSDDVVRVEIHDGIAVTQTFRRLVSNPPSTVDVSSPRGRGLLLLGSSSARFGVTDKGLDGKAIWFENHRNPLDPSAPLLPPSTAGPPA